MVRRTHVVRGERIVIEGLSHEQREAVEAEAERVLVTAGAGAGKTRVLTARYLRRLEHGSSIDEVVAVTFTDKAAGELKRRIREGLIAAGRRDEARGVPDAWITTIHGLCRRLLREHGLAAGVDPGARVLTEHEALLLASDAFEAAVQDLIEADDEDVAALLEVWDIGTVARQVWSVHARVAAAGRDPGTVEPYASVDADGLRRCAEGLASAAREMLEYRTSTTQQNNAEAAARAARALEAALHGGQADSEAARAALSELLGCSIKATVPAEAKEDVRRTQHMLREAQALLAEAMCAPWERGLARLVARFAERFSCAKRSAGAMDFEDLQAHTARILSEHPEVAASLRERFREVMVDEFQDTDPLQMSIASRLAGASLVAVGDKRQSIYRFRNADVRVFEEFATQALVKPLSDNWRSHPDIVAVVNAAFSKPGLFGAEYQPSRAAARGDDGMWPESEPRVRLLLALQGAGRVAEARAAEAMAVAAEVERLHRDHGIPLRDIAILSRAVAGGRARVFEEALRARGLEAVCAAGSLFETPEATDGVMLMRVLDNVLDDEALTHVLAGDIGRVAPESLLKLRAACPDESLWSGLDRAENVLDGRARERAVAVREAIRSGRRLLADGPPSRAFLHALAASGYEAALAERGAAGEQAWRNLGLLAHLADESDAVSGRGLHGFVREQRTLAQLDAVQVVSREGADAVRILTIHAAKGLEFPVVFVVGLTEADRHRSDEVLVDCTGDPPRIATKVPARLLGTASSISTPAFDRLSGDETLAEQEEGKRLLYVALTRAREALYLVGSLHSRTNVGAARRALLDALGVDLDPASEQTELEVGGVRIPVERWRGSEAAEAIEARPEASSSAGLPARPDLVSRSDGSQAQIPEQRHAPMRVSPSALEDFERCPYRYYAAHVLRMRDPAADEGATAFGTAAHAALQHVVAGTWDDARLTAIARRHGLDGQEVQRLDEAAAAFARSAVAERLAGGGVVRTESPFAMLVAGALVVGRMDVLAWDGATAYVVDFKWHQDGDGGEAAAEAYKSRYRRQMSCYSLAAIESGAGRVEAVVYDVAQGSVRAEWSFADADAAPLRAELEGLVERIGQSDFAHLPGYRHEACFGCPALGGVCPVRNPRRAGGVGRTLR
ncbi:MAG: UvrD-helicase domain-containing protein [Coriobacteriia bacterium]|nr:UvrD-helicase domain-containing protein [Coriobacteriia bacterium]